MISRRLAPLLAGSAKSNRPVVLYLGDERRRIESVDVLPWQEGLREMGL
jgi:hypothetical protein